MVRFLGDLDLAEEASAEAFAIAARRWPTDGVPSAQRAWLLTTARRVAIDRIRRERVFMQKLPLLVSNDAHFPAVEEDTIADERLEMLFGCCHPALSIDAQVALTLRAFGGLNTEQIARAFVVNPEAMKRRLSRAKAKIREAAIPFTIPPADKLRERIRALLAVIYLIFNEGYGGQDELTDEAVRLGRVLADLLPDDTETRGLLALMLFLDSRRAARRLGDDLVLLRDQDRSLWRPDLIAEAAHHLSRAVEQGGTGPYVLQASIAALQCKPSIDWQAVADLYGVLAEQTGSPIVKLNRAVAIAESGSPAEALTLTESLDLSDYLYYHSTRAELFRKLGRTADARVAYQRALEIAHREPERRFLLGRLTSLNEGGLFNPPSSRH